ncbi:hypothetical protein J1N35_008171 [Gossypium stocksii]|uniref:Aminotransferase-like plant mobile domain-containing protein n=1 Tax=Gossypium stocksii TaxID=47602 RepID=A0A9D4AG84_9ROSI|nr:hypothetical protein J1N35_008171 [Gossypium stocksii]
MLKGNIPTLEREIENASYRRHFRPITKDQIIEKFMRGIKQHLQEAGFLHISCMLEGTKLEPALINAFVKKWRFETHISSFVWLNIDASHVGIPDELEDIRLLLDQQSEAEYVKVPLIVFALVEMKKSDRVMR